MALFRFNRAAKAATKTEQPVEEGIKKFDPKDYYSVVFSNGRNANYIELNKNGMESVIEHYNEKYLTNISIPSDDDGKPINLDTFVNMIKNYLDPILKKLGQNKEDYREAFALKSSHSTPVIFIQEKGEKVFLIADSKGKTITASGQLATNSKLPTLSVPDPSQTDYSSCHAVTVLTCCIATAKDPKTGKYLIPNLLELLMARATDSPDGLYKMVLLPDEMLKFVQDPDFLERHKEKPEVDKPSRNVNKKGDIDLFTKNTTYSGPRSYKYNKLDALRLKGIKLAHVIEIRYYLKQLQQLGETRFTKEMREKFISEAKQYIKDQGQDNLVDLFDIAKNYAKALSPKKEM